MAVKLLLNEKIEIVRLYCYPSNCTRVLANKFKVSKQTILNVLYKYMPISTYGILRKEKYLCRYYN